MSKIHDNDIDYSAMNSRDFKINKYCNLNMTYEDPLLFKYILWTLSSETQRNPLKYFGRFSIWRIINE